MTVSKRLRPRSKDSGTKTTSKTGTGKNRTTIRNPSRPSRQDLPAGAAIVDDIDSIETPEVHDHSTAQSNDAWVERFALLAETAGELLRAHEPQKVVQGLCEKVMAHLDCQVFFNFLAEEKAGRLHLNACVGIPEDEAERIEWLDYGVAVCGCVARDGRRIVAEHIPATPDPRTDLVRSYGIKAYACHPLLGEEGKVIGTLSFGTRNRETFTDEALSLMKAVADQVSVAMIRLKNEQILRESREDLSLAQVVADTGSWRLDIKRDKLIWSDETYRMFGIPRETPLTYEIFLSFVHPDDREYVDQKWTSALRNGEYDIEHRIVVNGELKWVREKAELEFGPGGTLRGGFGIVQDITKHKRTEKALLESEQRLKTELDIARRLSELSALLINGDDIKDLYEQMLDTSVAIMHSDSASIQMLQAGNTNQGHPGVLRLIAWRGFHPQSARFWETVRMDSASTCAAALHDGKRVIVPDVEHSGLLAGTRDLEEYTRSGIRAVQSTPLISRSGRLLGMLSTHWRKPYDPPASDLRMFDILARQAADLIERKQGEEALRESEARFRSVLDNSRDVIYRYNVQTGRFEYISPSAETVTGFSPDELMAMDSETALSMVHPDDIVAMRSALTRVKESGRAEAEYRQRTKSGDYRWISNHMSLVRDTTGRPLYRNGNIRDITERKKAEASMAADLAALTRMHELSGRHLSAAGLQPLLQEVMGSAVATMGGDRGTLQLIEGGALRIVAHHGHQQPFLEFFASAETRASVCGEAMKAGERVIVPDIETSPLLAGTPSLAVLREAGVRAVQSTPIINRTGRLLGILTTQWSVPHSPEEHDLWRIDLLVRQAADLIEYVKAEEVLLRDKETFERMAGEQAKELLRTHAELVQAKRMADIGRLSSTIAHEMRNPLAAIKTAAFNIERKARNPLIEKHLETINKKVLESDNIINNLLSFIRIKSVSFEPVKIGDVLRDCIGSISTKYIDWKVEMREHLECDKDDMIEADSTQLKMLFCNILDNAYQALPDKTGTITVTAQKNKEESWEIAIADTGIGIDENEMGNIFEPFYTTKSRGTGLGLTVSREIMDMHNGRIQVQSAAGKGSVFTITLPPRRFTNQPTNQPTNQHRTLNTYFRNV